MAGYIEDRWLNKRPDPKTGNRERTDRWGKGKRYRVAGIVGVRDRSFDNLTDAKTWKAKAEHESRVGDFVDPRRGAMTLTEYIEQHWWPGRIDEPSTAAPMRSRIWNHIVPLIGGKPLRAIDASVLRAWKAELLARVESSTAEVIWIHLSTILQAAVDDGRLTRNPCRVHRSIKPPKRTKKKAKAWTREIVDAVRAGLQERYHLAVDLGVGLGLRQGEAFGLAEDDFDFEAGVVHVRRQLRWDSRGRPYFCLPKGGKTRDVPVSPRLAHRVLDALKHFPAVECTLPWRNPEAPETELQARQRKPSTVRLVLTTSHGNRIYYRTWNDRSWKPALAIAGVLKKIGEKVQKYGGRTRKNPIFEQSREDMFHVLRHTYASVQLEAGESIVSLSEWLGHASPNVTLEHYAHFMPQAGARGLQAMDSWFTPPEPVLPSHSPKASAPYWDKAKALANLKISAFDHKKVKYKETA
ncbi:tyrosine-type recombinase/integrase, partial [Streptomyces mesophilus]|uniref:tyrosine-type recombinase/integrase n=1 Tax=Streptomyces mesophilus TaxID=1775132 RepID=UPI0033344BA1